MTEPGEAAATLTDEQLDASLTEELLDSLAACAGDSVHPGPELAIPGPADAKVADLAEPRVFALPVLVRLVCYLRRRAARWAGVLLGDRVRVETEQKTELRGRIVGVCLDHFRDARPGIPLEYVARIDGDDGQVLDVNMAFVMPEPKPLALVKDDDDRAGRLRAEHARSLGAELDLRHGFFLLVFGRADGFRTWSIKGTRDEAAQAVISTLFHLHREHPLPAVDHMSQAIATSAAEQANASTGKLMDALLQQLGKDTLRLEPANVLAGKAENLAVTHEPSGAVVLRRVSG